MIPVGQTKSRGRRSLNEGLAAFAFLDPENPS
jgi:hypothetical protein